MAIEVTGEVVLLIAGVAGTAGTVLSGYLVSRSQQAQAKDAMDHAASLASDERKYAERQATEAQALASREGDAERCTQFVAAMHAWATALRMRHELDARRDRISKAMEEAARRLAEIEVRGPTPVIGPAQEWWGHAEILSDMTDVGPSDFEHARQAFLEAVRQVLPT